MSSPRIRGGEARTHERNSQSSATDAEALLEGAWRSVQPVLVAAFAQRKLNRKEYMDVYDAVYDYCHRISSVAHFPSENCRFLGSEIYRKLQGFVADHLDDICEQLNDKPRGHLLTAYCQHWKTFNYCARLTHGMFMYLNRHWVRGENAKVGEVIGDESVKPGYIHPIYGLCLMEWRVRVFSPMEERFFRELFTIVDGTRMNARFDDEMVYRAVGTLDPCVCFTLGPSFSLSFLFVEACTQKQGKHRRALLDETIREKDGVYGSFSKRLADNTLAFYKEESQQFLQSHTIREYIRTVHDWIKKEEAQCSKYPRETTAPLVMRAVETALIVDHLDVISAEYINLFMDSNAEDLGVVFELVSRVPSELEALHLFVEEQVGDLGREVLRKNENCSSSDISYFIDSFVEIHDRSTKLVHEAFKDSLSFKVAKDKALSTLLRTTSINAGAGNPTSFGEALAFHCDTLIKNYLKSPESDKTHLDVSIDKVIILQRYVEERESFQKTYIKLLVRRLLLGLPSYPITEAAVAGKFEVSCGTGFVGSLRRMLEDIAVSDDIDPAFQEYTIKHNCTFEYHLTFKILTRGAWPVLEGHSVTVPPQLQQPLNLFSEFYLTLHPNRKLTWLFHASRCELQATCFKKSHVIQASAHQAAILLCFNSTDSITMGQINETIQCDRAYFHQVMASLLKSKILMVRGETDVVEEENLDSSTVIRLNLAYRSKKQIINLSYPHRVQV